jgi:hypothetical protein
MVRFKEGEDGARALGQGQAENEGRDDDGEYFLWGKREGGRVGGREGGAGRGENSTHARTLPAISKTN